MSDAATVEGGERYHHGNLREALIAAAEAELAENGPERFSLRACARRAGVSHAAPAHHFTDAAGLLVALAALGFRRLTAAMTEEMAAGEQSAVGRLSAAGVGYVRYAVENPHLFKLMSTGTARHSHSAELGMAGEGAFQILLDVVAGVTGRAPLKAANGWEDVAAIWATVHGYAHLLIAGKMAYLTPGDFDAQRPAIARITLRAVGA
jgi:AcrR family transcriptional regulator